MFLDDIANNFISHGGVRVVSDWMNPHVTRCDWFWKYSGHVTLSVIICWVRLLLICRENVNFIRTRHLLNRKENRAMANQCADLVKMCELYIQNV